MADVKIREEFVKMCADYEKKYKKQAGFKSIKYRKTSDNNNEPVFYIGVPGAIVALTMTMITIATVYLLYLPFKWYIWTPYIIAVFFLFKMAMKLDKVRQIRYMVFALSDMSMKMIDKASQTDDEDKKRNFMTKAKEALEKADKWVDEPAIKLQLEEFSKIA
jgi:hypothetical protein